MIRSDLGPFALIPAWHLDAMNGHPKGRSSVLLRTYLTIAVRVSGRSDPWWIEGGIRGIAGLVGADTKDVRASVAVLVELGILERVHRRTLGDRGHHLASAYVLRTVRTSSSSSSSSSDDDRGPELPLRPVDNPGDRGDRGGQSPPHGEGGNLPPTKRGGGRPPLQETSDDEPEETDPPRRSPDCGERPQDAPTGDRLAEGGSGAWRSWLSEGEVARLTMAIGNLEAACDDSRILRDAVSWTTERVRSLSKIGIESPAVDLCHACGWGDCHEADRGRPAGRCPCCAAPVGRYGRSEVVDGRGVVLGWVTRPGALLGASRRGWRHEVARLERAAGRFGLWVEPAGQADRIAG